MAQINEQFIQVKTKANFESRLSTGDVKDTSIAFIEDTNEIWAKGKYYQAVPVNKGTTNQVLTKTDSGCDWSTPQAGDVFPEGGTTGQVLTKTEDGIAWQDASGASLPSGGTVGQVLTKTSDGAEWATHDSENIYLSDDYAASNLENEALEPDPGDSLETAVSKLHKAILDNEEVVTQGIKNIYTTVGLEEANQTLPDLSDTNYLQGCTTVVQCLKVLDAKLKELNNAITIYEVGN